MIRKQKEYINAERFQGNKVFKLIKDQKDLEYAYNSDKKGFLKKKESFPKKIML